MCLLGDPFISHNLTKVTPSSKPPHKQSRELAERIMVYMCNLVKMQSGKFSINFSSAGIGGPLSLWSSGAVELDGASSHITDPK